VDFQLLQIRLLAEIRTRIRNGEMTERSLARITGISQPHIHNVLKGARALSVGRCDRILERLRINLADLISAGESRSCGCRTVPLLDGLIGPGHAYPTAAGAARYVFPASIVEPLGDPVAARLAPDPHSPPTFEDGGMLLLDRAVERHFGSDSDAYFTLDLSGTSTIGLVRPGRRLFLWGCTSGWESALLPDRSPLEVIRGRVRLLVRQV
jgi:hypothetical protein